MNLAFITNWYTKIFSTLGSSLYPQVVAVNQFNNYLSPSSSVVYMNTTDGLTPWMTPFEGTSKTISVSLSLTDSSVFCLINCFSDNTYVLTYPVGPKSSVLNNSVLYTTVSKVLINKGISSLALLCLSTKPSNVLNSVGGSLLWSIQCKPTDSLSSVLGKNVSLSFDKSFVYLFGNALGSNVECYSTTNNLVQTIYPFNTNISSNYTFLAKYSVSDGTYQESDSVESTESVNFSATQCLSTSSNKIVSCFNQEIFQESTTLLGRNKDGTIGDYKYEAQTYYTSNKIQFENPGIYQFTIPSGCSNILIKCWGAGGSLSSQPNISSYSSVLGRGGGGGFSVTSINVSPDEQFYLYVSSSNEGGTSYSTFTGAGQGGKGGGCTYCYKFDELTNTKQLVCMGGGGGGGGYAISQYSSNLGPFAQFGSDGGPGGLNAQQISYENQNILYPAIAGVDGVGGAAGQVIINPTTGPHGISTNGKNCTVDLSVFGTGGSYSYTGYTWQVSAGGGGNGFGGGGAGGQINTLFVGNVIIGGGGAGGGSLGSFTQNGGLYDANATPSPTYLRFDPTLIPNYPGGYTDQDYPSGSYIGFGGTGSNPTGGNGYAVVYFNYYSPTGYITTQPNTNSSKFVTYKIDSRYLEPSTKNYFTRLNIYKESPFINDLFTPYQSSTKYNLRDLYTFIKGNVDDKILNQNFSIRNNSFDPVSNSYYIILNSTINTSQIIRKFELINNSFISQYNYVGNVSSSLTSSVVQYNLPSINNKLIVVQNFGKPINSTNSSYIVSSYQSNTNVLPITSITGSIIGYTGSLNNYGPFSYLTAFNQNALYTLQFYPSTIFTSVQYTIQLQTLILPARRIRDSFIIGDFRELTDFSYFFLEIFVVNDKGEQPPSVINNIYANNPNRQSVALFTIPTLSTTSSSNYSTYSSSDTPIITFYPNFYNIQFRLKDPNGNIIIFDNTPYKTTDKVFANGVVDPLLLNVTFKLIFTKF